jgi:hypothetical protein
METEKNYPVKQFLDSIGQQFKVFDSKSTLVKSSYRNTLYIMDRISKQNNIKNKRELLKQKVMKIERETGIYTLNVELLLRELLKQDQVSVYAFLDQKEFDQLN